MTTVLADLARDLSAYGLDSWGLFAVEADGSPRRLDDSQLADPGDRGLPDRRPPPGDAGGLQGRR